MWHERRGGGERGLDREEGVRRLEEVVEWYYCSRKSKVDSLSKRRTKEDHKILPKRMTVVEFLKMAEEVD